MFCLLEAAGKETGSRWAIYCLLSKIVLWELPATCSLKFWFSCSKSDMRDAQTVPKSAASAVSRTAHWGVLFSVKEFIFIPMDLQPLCTLIVYLVNWNLYQFQQMLQSKTEQEAMFIAIREFERRLTTILDWDWKFEQNPSGINGGLGLCINKLNTKGQDKNPIFFSLWKPLLQSSLLYLLL